MYVNRVIDICIKHMNTMASDISQQRGAQDYLTDLTKCYPSKVPRTAWVKANEMSLYTVHVCNYV